MFLFNKRISMLMLSISCCFASLQADFISLSVWERTTLSGEKQHLICCGDNHRLIAKADEQVNDIVDFLKQRNCSDDCVLIEGMPNGDELFPLLKKFLINEQGWNGKLAHNCLMTAHEKYSANYDSDIRQGDDWGLTLLGLQEALPSSTIMKLDYRNYDIAFFRYTDMKRGSLMHFNWKSILKNFDSFMTKEAIEEIAGYNDNEALNEFYHRVTAPLNSMRKFTNFFSENDIKTCLKEKHGDAFLFLDLVPREGSRYYVGIQPWVEATELIEYASSALLSELLDARFLHNIHQLQTRKESENVVFVCAGDVHVQNIESMLPKVGYTNIYPRGESSLKSTFLGFSYDKRLKDVLDTVFKKDSEPSDGYCCIQ